MSLNKNILKNILSKTYNFCGICFDNLEESSVHMQDELVITKNGAENTLKVCDVLYPILGEEIMDVIATFEYLCKQCVRSAVSSYKFLTMSKKNATSLKVSLENLSSSVDTASMKQPLYKSFYITIDPKDFSTQEFFDIKSPATSVLSPYQKAESSINPKKYNAIKNEVPMSYAKKIDEKVRKKRASRSSVHLKTTEMLYDTNDRTNLKCKGCKRVYPSLSNLRNHYIRVHAPKDFKCSICRKGFGSIGLLEQHKYQSHCTLVCTECGKTFYNRHTLKMHEISHYVRIVCEDCGRVYKSQTTFKKHVEFNVCGRKTRAHPSDAKFTCDYCNKKYTQKVSLRVHIQYEHGNYKAHVCKWCDKKFWAHSRLQAHIVKHTQEKKFGCNICGGKFVSKESLLYHTRIHTGEKPYKCHLCDKCFLSASRRAEHVKRYHSGGVLKCNTCSAQFATKLSLEKHKKLHSATAFKCKTCNAQFPTQLCLEKHTKTHSSPVFKCDICTAQFSKELCLKKHKVMHSESIAKKEKPSIASIFDEDAHLMYLRLPEDECVLNQANAM